MASILEIRKKIGAVKNTKKITKAMQLVAASKMRQFQGKAVASRSYMWNLLDLLHKYVETDHENSYTQQRTEGPTMFVLYTSDKGLCGSLNGQLQRALLRAGQWKNLAPQDRLLVTIGRKARDFARANDIPVEKAYQGLPEEMTTLDALGVVDDLLGYWEAGTVKEIVFVVPHYKNSFTFYPKLKTFLPFSTDMVESYRQEEEEHVALAKPENPSDFIYFEPGKERVMELLYRQITSTAFIQSFFELKASEYSSRMMAMQNATDNASKLIESLTRTYNKTRQQAITQQLSEIVAAGEAIQ